MERVVFQPHTYQGLQRGIHQIVEPIRATLGPLPRTVAMTSSFPGDPPELLDKGSIIARRIVQLGDRDADMGAMLVRDLLWKLHKTVGDATATAAVLFEAIFDEGIRFLAAGGNAMALRRSLEDGAQIILAELDRMTIPVSGAALARIAASLCADPALAQPIGELFGIFDADAQIEVRMGYGRETYWEYIDGAYWKSGALKPELLKTPRIELEDPAVLLTDLSFDKPEQIAPALEAALRKGSRSLVIFAENISAEVTAFLLANRDHAGFQVVAVKTPDQYKDRAGTLADLAVLLGGTPFLLAEGEVMRPVQPGELGGARRIWLDRDYVGVNGAKGDTDRRRAQIELLRMLTVKSDDAAQYERFHSRLGKLMGGSAILWVGGTTQREIKQRKEAAENVIEIIRSIFRNGVLPGSGISLLQCLPALEEHRQHLSSAEAQMAFRVLSCALRTPARTILANAGCDAEEILARMSPSACNTGYDILNRRLVNLLDEGIVESAAAYKAAVRNAIAQAGTALTIDVLIHTPHPATVLEPGQ